jgi:hypothetical protein
MYISRVVVWICIPGEMRAFGIDTVVKSVRVPFVAKLDVPAFYVTHFAVVKIAASWLRHGHVSF